MQLTEGGKVTRPVRQVTFVADVYRVHRNENNSGNAMTTMDAQAE